MSWASVFCLNKNLDYDASISSKIKYFIALAGPAHVS